MKKVPITVLTGYLGSGKTTLMNRILNNRSNMKVAVIVNDMSEINIDSDLIQKGSSLSRTEDKMISLSNGCICCTLREDLLTELAKLAKSGSYDYILIEASGISEPVPIAQTIMLGEDESGQRLQDYCYVDTMVSVVDAYRLVSEFKGGYDIEYFVDQNIQDEDSIINLLVEQIEFCDVLLLNKVDLVSESECDAIYSIVKKLQPNARIIKTVNCEMDIQELLFTHLFDFDTAINSAGWIKELEKDTHTPETEEYGISSMVYESKRPFHPERLAAWFDEEPVRIVRSKGVLWIASQKEVNISYSQAGKSVELRPSGYWLKYMDSEQQAYYFEAYPDILESWDNQVGDCMNKIVFIGIQLDKEKLVESLNQCLLTDMEMKGDWSKLDDPFFE